MAISTGVIGRLVPPEGADKQTLRRSTETLDHLIRVSLVLNSTLDITELLEVIMDTAAEITKSEGASILLMNKNTRHLHFVASTDNAMDQTIVVPLEGSIAGSTFTDNRPIIVTDTESDPRHFTNVDKKTDFKTRSLASVPMSIKDNVIGVLQAVNKIDADTTFTDGDVQRLSSLAAQAAVAIENARLVDELQEALDELGKIDKLKSDFIAVASHELRTPLGVILGYASFLKEDTQGESGEHVEKVLTSALQMRRIIGDMTNLRHVHMAKTEMVMSNVSVRRLMRDAQEDVFDLVELKGQNLSVTLPDAAVEVEVDWEMLLLAISNVLKNAIKFTPDEGNIDFSADVRSREVWLVVKDDGIGLEAEQLERIFGQFYQVEDHMTRRYDGLGLGLSIAKGMMERHQGRIWAESEGLGKGCTIYMSLPLVQSNGQEQAS